MSYAYTENGRHTVTLSGDVRTALTNGEPVTIALWRKGTWEENEQWLALGASSSSINNSLMIGATFADPGPDYDANIVSRTAAGVQGEAKFNGTADSWDSDAGPNADGWIPVVAVVSSSTDRKIYVSSYSNVGTNGDTADVSALAYLSIGANLAAGATGDFVGNLAEVAIWSKALNQSEIEAYLGGTAANGIAATDLQAYYPLNNGNLADSTGNNDNLSSAGTAPTGAAAHPTITAATAKYVKLLTLSSAASATGVEGVVLNAARDTVIGEFTGQAFEAALEGSPGEAVLLIDVADITPNGSTLTTSDAPIVFAYNTTDGTVGEGIASVIEV